MVSGVRAGRGQVCPSVMHGTCWQATKLGGKRGARAAAVATVQLWLRFTPAEHKTGRQSTVAGSGKVHHVVPISTGVREKASAREKL